MISAAALGLTAGRAASSCKVALLLEVLVNIPFSRVDRDASAIPDGIGAWMVLGPPFMLVATRQPRMGQVN